MLHFSEYPPEDMTYLSRADVLACCESIDIFTVVENALRRHALGETVLPTEAAMTWRTAEGADARSLAMLGAIGTDADRRLGMKVINGSLGNPGRGIARSQGVLMMFDQVTAWPQVIMESAYISAMRTAAVTAVAAQHLGNGPVRQVAVLGCGTLARANLNMLQRSQPDIESISCFDAIAGRAEALAGQIQDDPGSSDVKVTVGVTGEECVRGADLVITVTTSSHGYLPYECFSPGAVISHLSLDDVLPEVVRKSGLVVVDDWQLVSADRNRLLGRMYGRGELRGPDGSGIAGIPTNPQAPMVDTSLGEIVAGLHPGRASADDVVLCNPFGMAVLDVALGNAVAEVSAVTRTGLQIPR